MKIHHPIARPRLCAALAVLSASTPFPLLAADEIIIGNETWQQVEKLALSNGDTMLIVRQKDGPRKIPSPIAAPIQPETASIEKKAAEKVAAETKASASPAEKENGEADDAKSKIAQEITDIFNKETDLMDSSGLMLLGVTATDINRPVTPREFATAIARGVDASGKTKSGVSIEIAPGSLFFPAYLIGGETWERDRWRQVLARTSIGLATSKSENDTIGTQVAASIRLGLIDGGDPRNLWRGLESCALGEMKKTEIARDARYAIMHPEEQAKLDKKSIEDAKACFKVFSDAHDAWKEPAWYAGYAKAWYTGATDKIQNSKSGASVIWTSFSQGWYLQPKSLRSLLNLYAARKLDDSIISSKDSTKLDSESRTDIIARFRIGREKWNAFVDAGVARVNTAGTTSQNIRRIGYGAEYKVADNVWWILGSITERGYVSGDSKRTLLNTGLRFGQSDKSVIWPGQKTVDAANNTK